MVMRGVTKIVLFLSLVITGCTQIQPPARIEPAPPPAPSRPLTVVSWNIRGYPEKQPANTAWVHLQLDRLCPDVLCLQEIANQDRVQTFCANDTRLKYVAFQDSPDGMDNAIFTAGTVTLQDIPDPEGFQHPAQAAMVMSGGFDAVVVSLHLSWTNRALREKEMALLRNVVRDMSRYDPDVMLVGDFNLTEREIEALAQGMGMVVMVPAGQDGVGTTQAGNRYDHFLVTHDLADEEAISCRIQTFTDSDQVISGQVSDHLPIVATFRTDERYRDRSVR